MAYLGEERALVVWELHLRDVEELELPLLLGQLRLSARINWALSPESRPFCYRSMVLLLMWRELSSSLSAELWAAVAG